MFTAHFSYLTLQHMILTTPLQLRTVSASIDPMHGLLKPLRKMWRCLKSHRDHLQMIYKSMHLHDYAMAPWYTKKPLTYPLEIALGIFAMGFKKGGKLHNCHPFPISLGQDTLSWIGTRLKLSHPVKQLHITRLSFQGWKSDLPHKNHEVVEMNVLFKNITDPPKYVHYWILECLLYCVHKSPIS